MLWLMTANEKMTERSGAEFGDDEPEVLRRSTAMRTARSF